MSYTRTKTISVSYIDHVFHRDANGNVTVSEVERHKDIDINVRVDTTPFDNSVDSCGRHVGALTGSIVGFKLADVAVKKESEQAIVNSVVSGFTTLIDQNLTLQNAGVEAEMHALAGELLQQCKELSYKREVMNKDFNRIKSRYMELFGDINKELNNRIRQLIKPCFDFVSQVRKEQNRRIENNLLSVATIGGKENDEARLAIQASKIKHNAEVLIGNAKDFVLSNKSLHNAKQAFLIDGGISAFCYAPVVIANWQDEATTNTMRVYSNPIFKDRDVVFNSLNDYARMLKEKEQAPDARMRITNYFNRMLSAYNDGTPRKSRVAALANEMYAKNSIKTITV